jgi:hypothetical protein
MKEKQIELLRRGRVLPPADLVGCRPAGIERIPALGPGETVVFYDHFPRGFALPASSFTRLLPAAASHRGKHNDDIVRVRNPLRGVFGHLAQR